MNRVCVTILAMVAFALCVGFAPYARAAEEPLIEPVLTKTKAAPADWVEVGLKAARAGVVIKSATARIREVPQYALPLNDSGLMRDTAGDGVWTVAFTVPDNAPRGLYYLDFEAEVTVDGAAQTAAASVQVEVLPGEGRSVQILTPAPDAVLSGVVEVTAKLTTLTPIEDAYVYLGAASARMEQEGEAWKATLDTTHARNGRHLLLVVGSAGGTSADPERIEAGALAFISALNWQGELPVTVRNPYQYYWGDLHSHTSYSDGEATPADAYGHARDAAKLDFYALTDHDNGLTFDEYDDIRRQADAFDEPGRFAALYGVEWTMEAGHMCFFMCDRIRLADDLDIAYNELRELGAVAHFNHPGPSDFAAGRYSPAGVDALCAAEVRGTDEEASWVAMLNAGWRVGADGSQDKHDATWGDGPHWTVALARELNRESILDAVRARRTYSSFDRNMRLDFTLDGEDMGAVVTRPAGEFACAVAIADPDAGDATARIEAVMDGDVVASAAPDRASPEWRADLTFSPGSHYVYIRVTQADGNRAWSSPIWVNAY